MPNTKISALTAGNPALSTDALPIARGGANYQVTASSVAGLVNRLAYITASATPIVLTASSAPVSNVNGSGGQVIQLPNATTLTAGTIFKFDNNQSSGAITVNNNSGSLIVSVPSGGYVEVTLVTNGTAAGTWDRHDLAPANVSWSTNTFDYSGSFTGGTWNGSTVATNRGGTGLTAFTSGGAVYASSTSALTTGTLPIASGGTSATTKAAAFNALSPVTSTGDLIIGNGSNSNTRLGIGTNGYVLTSNGSTASWQAVSISGTLGTSQGGTGTTSTPLSGQLLIGTSFSSYQVANLTAGAGISITNSSGGITIAASGGGGPTINVLGVSTSSGSFNNSPPSSSISKPLFATTGTSPFYGAFFFQNFSGGYYVTSTSITSITGLDSTGASFNYTSGTDFNFFGAFSAMDDIVSCYGVQISNSAMQALFTDSKAAITTPSVAPIDASSAYGLTNPAITVSDSGLGLSWQNSGPAPSMGIVVQKSGGLYYVYFGTGNATGTFGVNPTTIQFYINGSLTSYISGTDFSSFSAQNNNSRFNMTISVSNPTLQTLLDNSFL